MDSLARLMKAAEFAAFKHRRQRRKDDAADISYVTRALFIGGAGNIKVDTLGGETVVISGIVAGSVLPLAVKRVHATSTTCTNIAGLY